MEPELKFQYELIPGFRASSKLLYIRKEEQLFKYKFSKENIKYYYCYQKGCKVGVTVDQSSTPYCRQIGKHQAHNHEAQSQLFNKLKVMNKIKYEVKNSAIGGESVRVIFERECKQLDKAADSLNYKRMRRQLYNIKQGKMSQFPFTYVDGSADEIKIEEVNMDTIYSTTCKELVSTNPIATIESKRTTEHRKTRRQLYKTKQEKLPEFPCVDVETFENKDLNIHEIYSEPYKECEPNNEMKEETLFEFEIIPGFRSSGKLLYLKGEKQLFNFKYKKGNAMFYYCYQKGCKVGVTIDSNNTKYCRKRVKHQAHNHETQDQLLEKLKLINNIKSKVKNAPVEANVRDIFVGESKKLSEAANSIDYESMRRQLYNIKQQRLPEFPLIPVNMTDGYKDEEVDINDNFGQHCQDVESNNKTEYLMFSYEIIRGFRSSSKLLYIRDEKQIFKFKYTKANTKYFYCYQEGCKVGVTVNLSSTTYCRQIGKYQHNHEPQGELFEMFQTRNKMKCDAKKLSYKRSPRHTLYGENQKFKDSDDTIKSASSVDIDIKNEVIEKTDFEI